MLVSFEIPNSCVMHNVGNKNRDHTYDVRSSRICSISYRTVYGMSVVFVHVVQTAHLAHQCLVCTLVAECSDLVFQSNPCIWKKSQNFIGNCKTTRTPSASLNVTEQVRFAVYRVCVFLHEFYSWAFILNSQQAKLASKLGCPSENLPVLQHGFAIKFQCLVWNLLWRLSRKQC